MDIAQYYNIMLSSKCQRPSGQRTMETRFDSHLIAADKQSRPCNDYITISEHINGLCSEKIMGNDDNKYLYTIVRV